MFEIYKKISNIPMSNDEINVKLSILSEYLQNKISNYTSNEKKQQRLEGLALLTDALHKNNRDKNDISLLYYNDFGKPFISTDIDFSISYSGTAAILGFVKKGIIGVDIEQIRPIDCNQFKDYFTRNEWDFLTQNRYNNVHFFRLWTRKEAAAKAIGKGAFLDFNLIDVLQNTILIEGQNLKLTTELEGGFCYSIATYKFI